MGITESSETNGSKPVGEDTKNQEAKTTLATSNAPTVATATAPLEAAVEVSQKETEMKMKRKLRHRLLQEADGRRELNGGVVPAEEWTPDDAIGMCLLCHEEFGVFTRRHHCRFCGLLVCSDCSPTSRMNNADGRRYRVCKKCKSYDRLEQHLRGESRTQPVHDRSNNNNNSSKQSSHSLLSLLLPNPTHQKIVFDLIKQQISTHVAMVVAEIDMPDAKRKDGSVEYEIKNCDLSDISIPVEDIDVEISKSGELVVNMGLSLAVEDVCFDVNHMDSIFSAKGRASVIANCIRAGVVLALKVDKMDVYVHAPKALVVVENLSVTVKDSMLSGIVNTFVSFFEKKIEEYITEEVNLVLLENIRLILYEVNVNIRNIIHDSEFEYKDLVHEIGEKGLDDPEVQDKITRAVVEAAKLDSPEAQKELEMLLGLAAVEMDSDAKVSGISPSSSCAESHPPRRDPSSQAIHESVDVIQKRDKLLITPSSKHSSSSSSSSSVAPSGEKGDPKEPSEPSSEPPNVPHTLYGHAPVHNPARKEDNDAVSWDCSRCTISNPGPAEHCLRCKTAKFPE